MKAPAPLKLTISMVVCSIGVCSLVALPSVALGIEPCSHVLIPTAEQLTSDSQLLFSMARHDVKNLYSLIKKTKADGRDISTVFGKFGVVFDESTSQEQFEERIRSEIQDRAIAISKSDYKALSRSYITTSQASEWGKCIRLGSDKAGMLLLSENATADDFHLTIEWLWQRGPAASAKPCRSAYEVDLKVTNGTIDGKTEVCHALSQPSGRVTKSVKINDRNVPVKVIANFQGETDTIMVSPTQKTQVASENQASNPVPKRISHSRNYRWFGETSWDDGGGTHPDNMAACEARCERNPQCAAWIFKFALGEQSHTCWFFNSHDTAKEKDSPGNYGGVIEEHR